DLNGCKADWVVVPSVASLKAPILEAQEPPGQICPQMVSNLISQACHLLLTRLAKMHYVDRKGNVPCPFPFAY
ncbi:MAG: hypothetical protein KDE28_23765, partial [Anaerolineales bacterium]|nr:hypothetical protein [Anaerolineales bacterium]